MELLCAVPLGTVGLLSIFFFFFFFLFASYGLSRELDYKLTNISQVSTNTYIGIHLQRSSKRGMNRFSDRRSHGLWIFAVN